MNQPKTICIPDNVPNAWKPEYRRTVQRLVADGFHVEHAELAAWMAVMNECCILDRIPDCPFAAEARSRV